MGFAQNLPERPVEGLAPLQWPAVENPLIARVVVEADDVQVALIPSELGPELTGDHVPGLILGLPVPFGLLPPLREPRVGHDVDGGVGMEDAGAGVDTPDRVHCLQGSPHELDLQLEAAAGRAGVDVPHLAPRPGPERDLVDRSVERWLVRLLRNHPRDRTGVLGEALNEFRLKDVEAVGPAVVAEVPDHLHPGIPRRPHLGQERREVVAARRPLDQVPAAAVADGRDPQPPHPGVVGRGKPVVPGGRDQIQPSAVTPAVAGALEAPYPKAFEHVA
jgi:hypothetical protein